MAVFEVTPASGLPPLNTPEDVALVAADTARRFPGESWLLDMLGIGGQSDAG